MDDLKFYTVVIDGGIFVFMMTNENLFLGVAEATRIDEDQKDLYEVKNFVAKRCNKELRQKFIEELVKNNIELFEGIENLTEVKDV